MKAKVKITEQLTLDAVGTTVTVTDHRLVSYNVEVIMGIIGPRGHCYIFQCKPNSVRSELIQLNAQCKAIKAFMRFQRDYND